MKPDISGVDTENEGHKEADRGYTYESMVRPEEGKCTGRHLAAIDPFNARYARLCLMTLIGQTPDLVGGSHMATVAILTAKSGFSGARCTSSSSRP